MQVIVLRALRTKLAESLAQVHAAASLLHLRAPKKSLQNGDLQPRLLLDLAKQNINQCAAMTAKVCFILPLSTSSSRLSFQQESPCLHDSSILFWKAAFMNKA